MKQRTWTGPSAPGRLLRGAASFSSLITFAVLLGSVITLFGLQPRLHELLNDVLEYFPSVMPLTTTATIVLALETILAAIFFAAAILAISFQPHNPTVFIMSLLYVTAGVALPGMSDALINPQHSTLVSWFRAPVLAIRTLGVILSLVLSYTFPDGRFVPRWTRALALAWVVLNVSWLLIPELAFNPIYGPTWRATPSASFLFHFAWFSTGTVAQIYRYRRVADAVQRQQLKWTAAALIISAVGAALHYGALAAIQYVSVPPSWYYVLHSIGRPLIQVTIMTGIPLYCLFVAVQRHRLWQIDLIINRALVYGALTMIVVAVYVIIVSLLGTLFEASSSLPVTLVATGVVAVGFHPLRERLQRWVNRLMFGQRDDPLAVLGTLGKQIEAAVSPDSLLPAVARTVSQALHLPHVAIQAGPDARRRTAELISASYGSPTAQRVPFPLFVQGQRVGTLFASPRGQRETLSPADQRILETIAGQISPVVQALSLTAAVQESRQRTIAAREEERRRLRRDLHDSLGPMLATLTIQTEAARDLMLTSPQQADTLLGEVLTQLQAALADIRRVVYGLRPPALDDLGLASALQEQAALYSQGQLSVRTTIEPALPALSAATEVAIYRIAQEALTNVVRHAQAKTCKLSLTTDDDHQQVILCVDDDGRGMVENQRSGDLPWTGLRRQGVGLSSMHERADELGGSCTIVSLPGKGTRVEVVLPW